MHWVNGLGTVLNFPACRKGKAGPPSLPCSSQQLFPPVFYQMLTLCCMQRGRQELSNAGARLCSNGSLSMLLEHFTRAGVREGSGSAGAVLSAC